MNKHLTEIRKKIVATLAADGNNGPLLVRLAWQCASTYRSTDFLGGCNGARVFQSPERTWPANAGLDKAQQLLAQIKAGGDGKYTADHITWADLIVLAGGVALEEAGSHKIPFCPGRTDAVADGNSTTLLVPGR